MNKQHKDIEQLFREGLHDHAQPPSSRAWKKLKKELGHEQKVIRLPWRAAAMLLLTAGMAVTGWFILERPVNQPSSRQKEPQAMLPETRFTVPDPPLALNPVQQQPAEGTGLPKQGKRHVRQATPQLSSPAVANPVQQPDKPATENRETTGLHRLAARQPALATLNAPELKEKVQVNEPAITVQFKPARLAGAERKDEQQNAIFNKVNSLFGEISLGDIRDAKNELIAGILNPKKGNGKTSD